MQKKNSINTKKIKPTHSIHFNQPKNTHSFFFNTMTDSCFNPEPIMLRNPTSLLAQDQIKVINYKKKKKRGSESDKNSW